MTTKTKPITQTNPGFPALEAAVKDARSAKAAVARLRRDVKALATLAERLVEAFDGLPPTTERLTQAVQRAKVQLAETKKAFGS